MTQKQAYRDRTYAGYSLWAAGEDPEQQRRAELMAAEALLWRVRDWLPADRNARWLDVGCGSGALLEGLSRAGYTQVEGIDGSPEQLRRVESRSARVDCADAKDFLATHPDHFEVISAIDVIEHFDRTELYEFIDLLRGALKPGGLLLLQTPNAASPFFGAVRYGDLTHELAFSPSSLAGILTASGFVRWRALECAPYVHGIASAVRWVAWQLLRCALIAWNLVETGSRGDGVWTRVFVLKAEKPS